MTSNFRSFEEIIKKLDSRIIIISLWLFLVFSLESIFRNPLFQYSLFLEENLQKSGTFIISLMNFFSFMGTEPVYLLIILFVINFDDTYKSYTILMISLVSTLLTGTLKIIYTEARPYYLNPNIIPFNCEGGYGNPSGHSLSSSAIYLTIWKLYFYDKNTKISSLLLFLFLIFSIMVSRLFMGVHSLNQIIFGFLLGFSLFFAVFFVYELDYNKFQSFVIRVQIFQYLIVNSAISLLILVIFFTTFQQKAEYIERIQYHCKNLPILKMLHKEILLMIPLFLSNIGAFIGIKYDIQNNYGSDMVKWCNENISHTTRKYYNNIYSNNYILSDYNTNHQWNKTELRVSLFRLCLLISSCFVLLLPFWVISFSSNVLFVITFKLFFPLSFTMFFSHYFFKIISKYLNLVNCEYDNIPNSQELI
jgi:membrane-associated phospholipid phosphatase